MKQILRIDHVDLVLPASTNLNALIKALSSAKRADSRYHESQMFYELKGAPDIQIKLVSDDLIIDPTKRKAIPANTGKRLHWSSGRSRRDYKRWQWV